MAKHPNGCDGGARSCTSEREREKERERRKKKERKKGGEKKKEQKKEKKHKKVRNSHAKSSQSVAAQHSTVPKWFLKAKTVTLRCSNANDKLRVGRIILANNERATERERDSERERVRESEREQAK